MPNNMEGRGLTDREMLQLCLEMEKGRCRSISNTMLESKHEDLRKIYQQCFDNSNINQYRLYEKMDEKDWYKTKIASTEEIQRVQELMQNNLHPDNQF
ncbi:spore coat protein [Cytobacillus massiliigabonensis]|uniref:spore coat protein n=1 Tax=Cytobacillus massiliigabonensis TaxID=1871011 RepID=UPI0015E095B4|nr:spore coat protein [Cytobacillus massiliigabonensis]